VLTYVFPAGVALGQLPQNRGGERQVSMGAMWSVGGVAPSTIAVDDGQGHLVRRRTNARLFPTPLQEGLVSTSVEKEKHEGRIASALKIDQVRKILEFAENQQIPRGLRRHAQQTEFSQTSWNGYQWANKEEWSGMLDIANLLKLRLTHDSPHETSKTTASPSSSVQVGISEN
jgi:meiosis-specific APC/C activator protein AMA1